MKGLIAKKVGMTQVFDESGNLVPVTVIRIDPNTVIATRTKERNGYDAVVLGIDDVKESRVTKAYKSRRSNRHRTLRRYALSRRYVDVEG